MDVIHHVKSAVGHVLRPVHAGREKLISADSRMDALQAGNLSLQSSDFEADGWIPRKYSGEGENISPPLLWSGVPREAVELVLICEDPDAPMIEPFIHWIMYGLTPDRTSLPEAVATDEHVESIGRAMQSKNSGGKVGYTGPMPPIGHGIHHYHFQLFAINERLKFDQMPGREDLIAAMSGHVVGMTDLIGTYERK